MRRQVSGLLGALLCFALGHGQAFIHQKLGTGYNDVPKGVLSDTGFPAWSAERTTATGNIDIFLITGANNFTQSLLGTGREAYPADYNPTYGLLWEGAGSATGGVFDVFLNNTNLSASVLGANRFASAFHLTSDGRAVWWGAGANTNNNLDIFVGSTNLTASLLGSGRDAIPMGINANNILIWDGAGSTLGLNRDVFRTNLNNSTTTNVSQPVLGTSRFAIANSVNANGDAVWTGAGTTNGDYNDAFFNATNLSLSVIGSNNPTNARDAQAFGVSGNTVIWSGRSSTTGQFYDTFVTTVGGSSTNLSSTPLGTGRESLPVAVANNYVLWEGIGASNSNNYDVFVSIPGTTRNLSLIQFGTGGAGSRLSLGVAVYSNGNAFWLGRHSSTGERDHLFYYLWTSNNSVNLTQEALGRSAVSRALATNASGQVLWAARNASDTEWEVYLSTPNTPTTLQGTVTVGGFVGNPAQIQLTIRLIDPFTGNVANTYNTNLTPSSTYSVNVAPGLWRLRITAPRVLARAFDIRRLLGTNTLDLNLILGDVNGDNIVDDADLLEILFAFGTNTSDPVDLNGDGVVDDADLLIVLFVFGSQGE